MRKVLQFHSVRFIQDNMIFPNIILLPILFLFSVKAIGQIEQGEIEKFSEDSAGISRLYYENNQVEQEGRFSKSWNFSAFKSIPNKEGIWNYYYKNGQVEKKGKYKKGNKEGLWVFYNEQGELLKIVFYEKSKAIDEIIFLEDKYWEKKEFKDKKGEFPAN